MIVYISADELVPPYNDPSRLEWLYNVGVDYATNTIDAIDKTTDEYISLFHFSKLDMKLCNRWSTYEINYGPAGITLNIKTNGRI